MKTKRNFPKRSILFISILSIFLTPVFSFGATINVPGDQPTIQAGIDAASNSDTVLVADGTYTGEGNKDLDFKGKAITVKSENGAGSCIIDCEGSGRGFYFHTVEGQDSVVSGFTITNGVAEGGGGIYCGNYSSPTITNCIISGNVATYGGGGIYCVKSSPLITDCTIKENRSDLIGGGILCLPSSSPTITQCTITGNTAWHEGGGIYCDFSSPTITKCKITNNTAINYYGGGIMFNAGSSATVINSIITGNTSKSTGGGIMTSKSSPTIINCTISENTAMYYGGGGIACWGNPSPTITNSILWNNSDDEIWLDTSDIVILYSDVKGGYPGEGNIDSDPLFVGSANYHLTGNSPCIDAGTSNGAPSMDIDGTPRPQGAGYDIGAYEFAGLPDTGQTKCYNNNEEITCPQPGEDFYGQDGDYLINPPSYTKLDAEGKVLPDSATEWVMVRDNVTGLIWEVKSDDGSIHDKDTTYTWQNSQDVFIAQVNASNFGGHSDWRLPTIKELASIVNYGIYSPAINRDFFSGTMSNGYWSLNPYGAFSNPPTAWEANFSGGTATSNLTVWEYHVRAVRGEQFGSSDSLTANGDGTVTDTSSGLMWQQETAGPLNWEGSLSYCENLTLAGYTDWRLPNSKELQSIVDYSRINPSINTESFPGTISSYYWSATTQSSDVNRVWLCSFYHGDVNTDGKSGIYYIRAVRGGQNQLIGPPTASTSSATSVTSGSATLNGTANPNFSSTTVVFEWGTDNSYGNEVTATQSPLTGVANQAVSAELTGLAPGTAYHYRVKATNSFGTTNGDDQTFTTSPVIPTVTTSEISSITSNSASSGGNITSEGGASITARGVCWSTSENPTTSNSKTTDATGTGSFTSSITGLSSGTTYHVRAYATNSVGTAYGQDITFTTLSLASGSLTVTLAPAGTLGTGVKWKLDAGEWQDSGTTVSDLAEGDYTVYFKDVDGWIPPQIKPVTIVGDQTIEILAVYQQETGRLPDTGQTKCYDNTGEIPCPQPGENFYGQDGNYLINAPSYTKLDENGNDLPDAATEWVMVRDNVTGLIWEVKTDDGSVHDKDDLYNWYDAQNIFIAGLNDATFGGYSDWRLPSIKELRSIVHYHQTEQAIHKDYFPHTQEVESYFSSTNSVFDSSDAWFVRFYKGEAAWGSKSQNRYVRAVRGGNSGSLNHFVNNLDGTVTDTSTGLMWQQATATGRAWDEALSYCKGITLAGHTDWRLPNIKELASILEYTNSAPAVDTEYFPDTSRTYYWSSTNYLYDTSHSWSIYFDHGGDVPYQKGFGFLPRSVRGGQSNLPGHLFVLSPAQASALEVGDILPISWEPQEIPGKIRISVSYQGGKNETFEIIEENTENDGIYEWTVTGPISVNCVLKIEPLADLTKGTTQGLFTIYGSPDAPTVTTNSATSLTSSTATLNGTVNPNGTSTTVVFECGTTVSYGSTITAIQSPLTGTDSQPVSVGVMGLTPDTTYHFRVKGTNSAGTTNGEDQTFTTASAPPVIAPTATTNSASTVTSTSATLKGTVNPNGSMTTYYFEYGTTASYGETTPSRSAGSGTSDVGANTSITELSPETTYHYRVVAVNSSGTSLGADEAFATSSLRPTVTIGSGSVKKEDKITLPITLINIPGTDIAAISVDIGYDSSVFKNPKATIGPAGSAVDKIVGTADVASGIFRVSIFSVSNNTAIGDGVVAYLTLDIEKDAFDGEFTLTNTPYAADPQAYPVVIDGVDGLVNIMEYEAGDCNHDGTVSIDEVQSAINMALGYKAVEACVDVNGNGKVSVGEVQKVINNHLGISTAEFDIVSLDSAKNTDPGTFSVQMEPQSTISVPLLSLTQTTGAPGDTVTITMMLTNASGYEIASVMTGISYDTDILENPKVEIGPAGVAAEKTIVYNELSKGYLKIGLISGSDKIIADGILAYLTFQIKADASFGQTALGSSPEASDLAGNDVPIWGNDGVIQISIIPVRVFKPVYRFYSPTSQTHFWTISEEEKDYIIANYSAVWTYIGIAWSAYDPSDYPTGSKPVYRFWAPQYQSHFWTISEEEKDFIIANYAAAWTYIGIAWYAYDPSDYPAGSKPVYRFWAPQYQSHFWTISEEEKDFIIANYPTLWTYIGIAWYAYDLSD